MPEPFDLETVIQDSITDASLPEDTSSTIDSVDSYEAPVEDTPTEGLEAPVEPSVEEEGAESSSLEVASPGARQDPAAPTEQVDKKLGIPSHTNGRENRIPYSRVKKIVEGAEKKAIEPLQAKLAEYEPRVKEYEARLQRVAEFEQVMVNDPPRFFDMLATIPAYQGFFQMLNQLQQQAQTTAQATPQTVADDPMPGPDDAENGVYTLDGLNKLLDWQKRQAKNEVLKEVESKYEPIRQQYETQQRLNKLVPVVENQIKEARTWEKFNENEDKIVQFLNANPNASLETAYRVVVLPQLKADRDATRKQVLAELQKAPVAATSVAARPQRPVEQVNQGPRSMEDVILEQIRAAGLR
jgi:hypothetical protein